MTNARQVYELQEVDLALDGLRARLKAVEARLGDRSSLDSALRQLETQRAKVRELTLQQRSADGEVATMRQRMSDIELKLYGGSVTSARDLQSLQRELGALKEQVARAEESLLQLMETVERAQAALAQQEAEAKNAEPSWQLEQASLLSQASELKAEIERLVARRAAMAQGFAPQELAQYERLRATRGGVAVATVERAVCGGCRVSLPTHLVQRARVGRELTTCPSCGRILLVN